MPTKLAALFSGGKDSTYALWWGLCQGFEVACLLSVFVESPESWMFHYPNLHVVELQAEAVGIPLLKIWSIGEKERELEDLKRGMAEAVERYGVEGVVSGALASEYQRCRIDRLCEELGLMHLSPLWHKDMRSLLREFVEEGFEAIITSVSAYGMDEKWLGRGIDHQCVEDLIKLNRRYGIHLGGEGGEFETLVLDAPFFRKRVVIERCRRVWRRDSGYLLVEKAYLAEKTSSQTS